jgi:hypothetical protein
MDFERHDGSNQVQIGHAGNIRGFSEGAASSSLEAALTTAAIVPLFAEPEQLR